MAIRRQKTNLPVTGGHAVTIVRLGMRREISRRTRLPKSWAPRQTRIETVELKYAPIVNTGKDYAAIKREAQASRWQRLAEKISSLVGSDPAGSVRVGA